MRSKSGFLSSAGFLGAMSYYFLIEGPNIESDYVRYALCGTVSTVAVELMTHIVDTKNQQSKVIKDDIFDSSLKKSLPEHK